MRSTFLRTYVILAVAVGFGAWLYFVESKRPAGEEEAREKVFPGLSRDKIVEVSLAKGEELPLKLARERTEWFLSQPLSAQADEGEVTSLLTTLESLELEAVVAEGEADLAQFGLASPRLSVEVLVEGATEPLKLLLGDKAPAGGGLYARKPAEPRVFTVAAWHESAFDKKPFDFRDRQLLKLEREAVDSLEIEGPEGRYALARQDGERWAFTAPLETRAGRWSVDGLLSTLVNLRMDAVAAEQADALAEYGLAEPKRRVRLGLSDGTSQTLFVGSSPEEGKHHAMLEGAKLVAVIPGALVGDLEKGMAELRAKRLLEVSSYEVKGFELVNAAGKRVFERSVTKDEDGLEKTLWKQTAPTAADKDADAVQDALFKIGGVEVASFLDAPGPRAGYGLEPPALALTLRYEGKPEETLALGSQDGVYYAARSDDAAVLQLEAEKAKELIEALEQL